MISCAALQDVADRPDAPPKEKRSTSQISFLVGARDYSDDTLWGEVNSSVAVGAEYSESSPSGLGWEAGALGSISSSGGNVSGAAAELFGGVRKTFHHGRWRPYASAGVALLYAGADDAADNQVSDNIDLSPGLYLRGGVQYDIDEKWFLGIDLRAVGATSVDATIDSGDADYIQGLFVVGLKL